VLKIDSPNPADWKVIKDLKTGSIPRGMAVSEDSKYLYVAQMGSNFISVVDLSTLEKVKEVKVGPNPRHIILSGDYMYVSLNAGAQLLKINLKGLDIVGRANTLPSPRTIAVSEDRRYIFVTCYSAHQMQVFDAETLMPLGHWRSYAYPVAVTVFQDENSYEAWVGNHTSGTITVFNFILDM